MTIIGSAYVDIRAITDHLEADIKKALATLPDKIDVNVYADTTAAETQLDTLIEWGNLHNITVKVEADTDLAQIQIEDALHHADAVINVDANVAAAEAHIEEVVALIQDEDVNISLDVDTVAAEAHVGEFIDAAEANQIDVPVDVNEVVAETKMAMLMAKLQAIADLKMIKIPIDTKMVDSATKDIQNSFGNMFRFLDGLSGAGALAGLAKELIAFKINLGNEVPKITMLAEKIGSAFTGISWASMDILSLASSIGQLGGVALAMPGILTGFVIGMKLTTTAFGDMKRAAPDLFNEFKNLKDLISQDFWSQARTGLQDLIAPTSVLRAELGSTSQVLGSFWGTMFEGMSKGSFATAMAGDFDNLKRSIEITTNGSTTFLHVIQTLGEFGSAYLPKLAQSFLNVSERFDAFLTKANADGTLTRWVDNGVKAFKDLGGVITNTSAVIGGLMKAAVDAGGASLGILSATMEHFAAVIKEPAVQTALVNIFSGARIAISNAVTGLGEFLKGVGYLSPALKVVEQDVGIAIHNVLTFFGAVLTNPTLFKGIQDLFGGIVSGLNHFADATGPVGDKLGVFFTVIGTLADSLGGVFANAIIQLLPVVSSLLTEIIPLIKPLGEITIAITNALAPAIGILVSTAFPPLINMLLTAIIPALQTLAPILGTALPPMAAAFADAIAKLAPIIGDLIIHLTPVIEKLIEIGVKAIPVILSAIIPLIEGFDKFLQAIEPIITPILDAIKAFLDMKGAGDILLVIIAMIVTSMGVFNVIVGAVQVALGALPVVLGLIEAGFTLGEIAAGAFAAALAATGIGLIVIAIAALIAGIILLIVNWDAVTKAVSDFANDAGKNLGDFFNSTGSMITDFNNNTNGMFTDFFNSTMGMFGDFFKSTAGMFTDFFNNTVGMIVDWGTRSVGMFVDFFNNTVGMVKDWGTRTVGMFVDFFTNTVGMFTDFFNKVVEGFKGFAHDPIGEVRKFVTGITEAIKNWGIDMIITVAKFFEDIKHAIIKWAVDVAVSITKFFTDVKNGFDGWKNDVIRTVVTWAADLQKTITKFGTDTFGMFMDFFKNTAGMFGDFFRNTDGMFSDFFASLPNAIETFKNNSIGMIRDFDSNTRGMFNDFFNGIGGMWNDFFGKNLPDAVNTFVSNTTGMINDFNSNTNGMFMDFFSNTLGMWNDFVGGINNTVNAWVAGIIGMFLDFYNQTTGETRAFLDGFIAAVGGWVNQTIGMFADFGSNTVGMFVDMWNNANNAVQDGLDSLRRWFSSIGDTIMSAIGDPGTILSRAGTAIMDGFLGGLRDGFKGVQDMVGGVADWIAQHKGPEAYDRALLVPHGGWIMGGLKQGIEGSMGSLKKTLSGVTDLISDTMNTSVSVNVSNGISGSNRNPNIFTSAAGSPAGDPFAAAAGVQDRYGNKTVVTPTVNVYPSAPLNEKQVGQMAAQELYWNFVNR
jgi:phage-related protein